MIMDFLESITRNRQRVMLLYREIRTKVIHKNKGRGQKVIIIKSINCLTLHNLWEYGIFQEKWEFS